MSEQHFNWGIYYRVIMHKNVQNSYFKKYIIGYLLVEIFTVVYVYIFCIFIHI